MIAFADKPEGVLGALRRVGRRHHFRGLGPAPDKHEWRRAAGYSPKLSLGFIPLKLLLM
jgi:hypothetical protein